MVGYVGYLVSWYIGDAKGFIGEHLGNLCGPGNRADFNDPTELKAARAALLALWGSRLRVKFRGMYHSARTFWCYGLVRGLVRSRLAKRSHFLDRVPPTECFSCLGSQVRKNLAM